MSIASEFAQRRQEAERAYKESRRENRPRCADAYNRTIAQVEDSGLIRLESAAIEEDTAHTLALWLLNVIHTPATPS